MVNVTHFYKLYLIPIFNVLLKGLASLNELMRLARKQHLSGFYDYVPSFGEPGQGLRVLKVLAIVVAPVAVEPIVRRRRDLPSCMSFTDISLVQFLINTQIKATFLF